VEELSSLTNSNGEELEIKKRIALCRCGASHTKPFCDGTHKTDSQTGSTNLKMIKRPRIAEEQSGF
jgi:CDGSH-type Zn-finger protein